MIDFLNSVYCYRSVAITETHLDSCQWTRRALYIQARSFYYYITRRALTLLHHSGYCAPLKLAVLVLVITKRVLPERYKEYCLVCGTP